MARGRVINRELVNSQEFFDLPYWADLLWVGMITNASDEGLISASAEWLRCRFLVRAKSVRCPSSASVVSVLCRWRAHGMLDEVTKTGRKYFQIKNWHLYQPRARARDERMGDEGRGGDVSPSSFHSAKKRRRRADADEESREAVRLANEILARDGKPPLDQGGEE